MTRLGEICSIVVATFHQISRSAIKKAEDFWPISAGMRLRNHVRSSLLKREMAARSITVEGYETQWLERYQDEALKLREMLAGVLTAIHHIGSTAVPNQRLISCWRLKAWRRWMV
ncbi:GrpB family protein [Serratia nevei]|nr:GrpB family protein [Serratia nevei]